MVLRMRTRPLALLAALVAGVSSAGCTPPAAPAVIRVAASLPSSSPEREVAAAWQRGYQRAVAEANVAGGLELGRPGARVPVELTILDDRGDLAQAETLADDLLSSGIHVLLATPGTVRMAAQAAVAERHQRPYVVPARAGPDLTATRRAWVLVAPTAGNGPEDDAYQAMRAALDALRRAGSAEAEAVRRSFTRADDVAGRAR